MHKRKNEPIDEKEQELAFQFWTELSQKIPEWQLAAKRKVSSADLRRDYVHAHSNVLHALGIVGNALLQQHPEDWQKYLFPLQNIDWLRSNTAIWEGRAMVGGQMSKARQNVQLTANFLKIALGLELTSEETKLEEKYHLGLSGHASTSKTIPAKHKK